MPTEPRENDAPRPSNPDGGTLNAYQQLRAFLEMASGFRLAVARCNLPSLRKQTIERAVKDATAAGVKVLTIDISNDSSADLVSALHRRLPETKPDQRVALMVTGIDGLVQKGVANREPTDSTRPPYVARLNYDRERLAAEIPYPIVLWVESETLKLLLREAPDFTRWVSVDLDFGGTEAVDLIGSQLFDRPQERLLGADQTETRQDLADLSGLLRELDETADKPDELILRKRLAILFALGERYERLSDTHRMRALSEEALELARRLGDRRSEAAALGNLGIACSDLGETRRAIEFYEQRLVIAREIGDRRGEGAALGNLGVAYSELGEPRRAIELYGQRLAIAREIGDRRGEGNALGNLGIAYDSLGAYRRAIEYYDRQLAIVREIGDRRGEGAALGNLGLAYRQLGKTRRAIEFYEQHIAIAREIGDRRGEGAALGNLGLAYADVGEPRRAIEYHEKALAIDRDIGDRRGEGQNLGNLGLAYADLGETRRAIEYYEQSLAIERQIGDRRGEGNALFNMGVALDQLGDRTQAIARAEAALKIYEAIEDPNTAKVRAALAQWRDAS